MVEHAFLRLLLLSNGSTMPSTDVSDCSHLEKTFCDVIGSG